MIGGIGDLGNGQIGESNAVLDAGVDINEGMQVQREQSSNQQNNVVQQQERMVLEMLIEERRALQQVKDYEMMNNDDEDQRPNQVDWANSEQS